MDSQNLTIEEAQEMIRKLALCISGLFERQKNIEGLLIERDEYITGLERRVAVLEGAGS